MSDKVVSLKGGTVAVVWYESHDSSPQEPKRVHDLVRNELLYGFTLQICVEGGNFWILEVKQGDEADKSVVRLTRYCADGTERTVDVPSRLDAVLGLSTPAPVPVWVRAVVEAHNLVCLGRQGGCGCTELRRKIDESGALL